jgi:hypothetical protein
VRRLQPLQRAPGDDRARRLGEQRELIERRPGAPALAFTRRLYADEIRTFGLEFSGMKPCRDR